MSGLIGEIRRIRVWLFDPMKDEERGPVDILEDEEIETFRQVAEGSPRSECYGEDFESPRYYFHLLGDNDSVLRRGEAQQLHVLVGEELLYTPGSQIWKLFERRLPV
jgi:hypothetical protein